MLVLRLYVRTITLNLLHFRFSLDKFSIFRAFKNVEMIDTPNAKLKISNTLLELNAFQQADFQRNFSRKRRLYWLTQSRISTILTEEAS